MRESAKRPEAVRKENIAVGKRKDFGRRICDCEQMTARRAYEIFERKGRTYGHDLEDWFEAQAELFVPVRGEFIEGEFSLEWRAEARGFHACDLEVHVDPRRMVLLGRKIAKGTTEHSEPTICRDHAKEIYKIIELPVEVDPGMATANIQNGVMGVFLLKAGNPMEAMSLAAAA